MDVYLSVFQPTTLFVTTFLGVAYGAFFWATMTRVSAFRVLIVYLPAAVFMLTSCLARYIDGSHLWPAWLAALTLWTWAVCISLAAVAVRRRLGRM